MESEAVKPVIGITMGDAAGIGPELVVKLLAHPGTYELCRPLVIGDPQVIRENCRIVGAEPSLNVIEAPSQARYSPPHIDVLTNEGLRLEGIPWGRVDPAAGRVAALCLQEAFRLAMSGQVQGVVSAPLNKEAFHRAGYRFADELAYLADLTHSPETLILGAMGAVWTAAVTEHVAFVDIPALIKRDRILWVIVQLQRALGRAGVSEPRIGVAALNVHAGDGGLFGREEIDQITPAILAAREQGLNVQGPVPADVVFARALAGHFDGVVAMTHDQANIARKLQPRSVSATLFMGLPVACGTTAHGTAFDIAGQGIADPGSLQAALRHTARLARG